MRFPFYKQLDAMDCGPSCLRMIAKHYGRIFPVQQLRELCFIQRTGVCMLGISEVATRVDMRTNPEYNVPNLVGTIIGFRHHNFGLCSEKLMLLTCNHILIK